MKKTIDDVMMEWLDYSITDANRKKIETKYNAQTLETYLKEMTVRDWNGSLERKFIGWVNR